MKSLLVTLSVLVALAATGTVGWLVLHQPSPQSTADRDLIPLHEMTDDSAIVTTQGANEVTQPAPETLAANEQNVINALADARRCYEQPSGCHFSNDDPRMEDIQAGQHYRAALSALHSAIMDGQISGADGRQYALDALAAQDGHVQAMALSILADIDAHPEMIYPLLTVIETSHDAKITETAMVLLSHQPIDGYQPDIDDVLQNSLQTGSVNVSPVVAQSILPYLNDDNVNEYVDLLLTLPDGSQTHQLLDVMLEEYALMQMGG